MEAKVIAIHGDYANGEIMRRDMGDPVWVDQYVTWKSFMDVADVVCLPRPVVLIGYSRGADHVRRLLKCSNVIGAVAYEPLATGPVPSGKPLMVITNDMGRSMWTCDGKDSSNAWIKAGATWVSGRGFHVSLRWGWPPIGHAWDRRLNDVVDRWLLRVLSSGKD